MKKINIWQISLGILLIAFGLHFFLSIFGMSPLNYVLNGNPVVTFWPLALGFIGVVMFIDTLIQRLRKKEMFDRIYLSLSVVTFAGFLQLRNLGILPEADKLNMWLVVLALFVLYAGIKMVFFKSSFVNVKIVKNGKVYRNGQEYEEYKDLGSDENSSSRDKTGGREEADRDNYKRVYVNTGGDSEQFIGSLRLGDTPWSVENMNYNVNVGDIYIDFTKGFFEAGETEINIKGWVGNMEIIFPEYLAVDMQVKAKIGALNIRGFGSNQQSGELFRYKSDDYEAAEKRLKFTADLGVGNVEIRRI